MINLSNLLEKKYHYDTGLSGEEESHAEQQFNQHHHASMYAKHFGITADKDTVDFDDEEEDRNPGKVIPYDAKKDKIDRGYEPLSTRKLKSEYHHNTPSERINSYNERIKNIKDKLQSIQDKTSDTYKLQQGKLKAVIQTLANYKQQQSINKIK
jgi:vacuolar-type H+-ATPase subunit I/STV1